VIHITLNLIKKLFPGYKRQVLICHNYIHLISKTATYSTHTHTCTRTHTHPFNGPLSGTTQVSRYQKGKTNLDFTEATDSEWQWHQLGHMQVCTSLQIDNHATTPPLSFYRPDALPAAQPTASKHWRHKETYSTSHLNIKTYLCFLCIINTQLIFVSWMHR